MGRLFCVKTYLVRHDKEIFLIGKMEYLLNALSALDLTFDDGLRKKAERRESVGEGYDEYVCERERSRNSNKNEQTQHRNRGQL